MSRADRPKNTYRFVLASLDGRIDSPSLVHQISHVLKLAPGSQFIAVCDGDEHLCQVQQLQRRHIVYSVDDLLPRRPSYRSRLRLYVPVLSQPQRIELILQKCTEIGADEFVLVRCERSTGKYPEHIPERWHRIITEATEQSERNTIPSLSTFSMAELCQMTHTTSELRLLCCQHSSATMPNIHQYEQVSILTGPEGGLTAQEQESLIAVGFRGISLGLNTLRAETAPIVASALIRCQAVQ